MKNIVKNDTVQIISGNSKGKKGKVLRVFPVKERIIVEGVNIVKRHTKPNPQAQQQGGIVEKEAPVQMSDVMVVCGKCDTPTRIGIKMLEDGSKARQCKKCGEVIENK